MISGDIKPSIGSDEGLFHMGENINVPRIN
jgi:hypothetical protein